MDNKWGPAEREAAVRTALAEFGFSDAEIEDMVTRIKAGESSSIVAGEYGQRL